MPGQEREEKGAEARGLGTRRVLALEHAGRIETEPVDQQTSDDLRDLERDAGLADLSRRAMGSQATLRADIEVMRSRLQQRLDSLANRRVDQRQGLGMRSGPVLPDEDAGAALKVDCRGIPLAKQLDQGNAGHRLRCLAFVVVTARVECDADVTGGLLERRPMHRRLAGVTAVGDDHVVREAEEFVKCAVSGCIVEPLQRSAEPPAHLRHRERTQRRHEPVRIDGLRRSRVRTDSRRRCVHRERLVARWESVLLEAALAPAQRVFLELGGQLVQRGPEHAAVSLWLVEKEQARDPLNRGAVLRDRGREPVVAVGRNQAGLVPGLGHAVAVLLVHVLGHDRLRADPALKQQRELFVVGRAQEAAQRRLARLEQQRHPGAGACGVEPISAPRLEVEQVLQLGRGAQRDEGQGIGRPDLAYGQVELGIGQRPHDSHGFRGMQQQLESVAGRKSQR